MSSSFDFTRKVWVIINTISNPIKYTGTAVILFITFLTFPFLKNITAKIIEITITTVNTLYPQSFIVTSVKPDPYIEYAVSPFNVKNLFVPISCIPTYVRIDNNITITIV